MKPEEVSEELIDLAMTGANPGCRYDASFYLANVLPEIDRRARAKVFAEAKAAAAEFGERGMKDEAAILLWFADRAEAGEQP